MDGGGWAGAVFGLLVLAGLGALMLWAVHTLAITLLREMRDALEERLHALRHGRAARRRARAWAGERAALEARHLLWRQDEDGAPITSAILAGDLVVTGHRDGRVRLRLISRVGEPVGGFETGADAGLRVFASPDGRCIATARGAQLTLRGRDGAPLATVSSEGSEALQAWLASADSLDGYLAFDQVISGAAFGTDGVLTVAWDGRHGPDGGPGPVYGSASCLVRSYRWGEGGAPLLREVIQDLGRGPSPAAIILGDGGQVIAGRWLIDAATGEARRLPPEMEEPRAASPDGRWLVAQGRPAPGDARCRWALWDLASGERCRVWEDSVHGTGGAAWLGAGGGLCALPVQEPRPLRGRPGIPWTATLARVYDTASGRAVATLPVAPLHLASGPGGLLTVDPAGVALWRP